MKKVVFSCFVITLCLSLACSSDSEPVEQENTITSSSSQGKTSTPSGTNQITNNPHRHYFDVVIVDNDRWEICLNTSRIRQSVTSYGNGNFGDEPAGMLWFQVGSNIFEGPCTAMYNPLLDIITVTAKDNSWEGGHITYTLKFEENSNYLVGTYVYYEYPRRTNRVWANLVQGRIGGHEAGPSLAKAVPTGTVPDENPKKLRAELRD